MAGFNRFVLPPPPNPDDDVNGYSWRDWFRQLRDYLVHSGAILWSQIDFTGSKLSDIVNRPHNVLQSMQGGNSVLNQYYHLTQYQHDNVVLGPASATDNAIVRFDGTTGKLVQNSAVTIDDAGNIISPDSVQFSGTVPATQPIGTMWFDGATDTLNFQQNNITQQIGEEIFMYIRASDDIVDGQVIARTGTDGTSGVIKAAPAPIGTTDSDAIIGIATEAIAKNSYGRITFFGIVHGLNTTGYADGDNIYYDPAVVGGYTKTKPTAPNLIYQLGTIIKAAGGTNGSIQVRQIPGSVLGGTDSNVKFGTLADGDLIQYYAAGPYWRNVTPSSVLSSTQTAPVTKTANFTVGATDQWIINNKSGSGCVATLPTASSYTGRILRFQNYQDQTLTSASSNVVPIAGGAATTAILNAVAGDTCTLVSDGSNWIMTQYVPNNILLI